MWPFGGHDKEEDEDQKSSEQMLYRSAQSSLRSGNYRDAITKLQKLEARFPFGRYAEQAQLELIYANFMSYQPEAARSAADRFIRLHPQHPNVDYAYYIKGLAEFNKDRGLLDRFAATDISKRDPTSSKQAFDDFSDFLQRHPDSEYAADARQRMVFLVNVLAQVRDQRRQVLHAPRRIRRRRESRAQRRRALFAVAIGRRCTGDTDRSELAVGSCPKRRTMPCAYSPSTIRIIPAFDDKGHFVFRQQTFDRDRSWLNMMTFGLIDRPKVPPPIAIDTPPGVDIPAHPADPAPPAKPNKPWWRLFG